MTSIPVDTDIQKDDEANLREVQSTYNRIAPLYDLLDAVYERSWKSKLRAELFARAGGKLLDVGVGTGCNMPFYPKSADVVGIDASRSMLARARKRAQKLGVDIDLREMNLLNLNFDDGQFDTVVATFVLLCLPEELQRPALIELGRV
ncbi:MAG: class I SAM-dependent methyltransferase, partial [Pseudomonadota bacterium]